MHDPIKEVKNNEEIAVLSYFCKTGVNGDEIKFSIDFWFLIALAISLFLWSFLKQINVYYCLFFESSIHIVLL